MAEKTSRNVDSTNEYEVDFWRQKFTLLKEKTKEKSLIRTLASADAYYDSLSGMNDYKNILQGKAGLAKTRRAVLILETATVAKKKKAKSNNLLKRQKLEL